MDDVEEKRVFGGRTGKAELLVAAAVGVVSVEVSADRVGRFGVAHRCDPVDVASGSGLAAIATPTDVLLRGSPSDPFVETAFGPAAAVGVDDGVVAASPDGRLARIDPVASGDDEAVSGTGGWEEIGSADAEVRAIDPPLLATSAGVHRLPDLDYVGLDDVRDVAAAGPLAATAEGLYSLGNGWLDELGGAFGVAAAATDGLAHAATPEAFFERRAGRWAAVDLPVDGPVVDVSYGEATYAVTADGVLLARDEDDWRTHPLGVDGVVGCARS